MTDPILPLIGFAFGAVGFLSTVRNGIDLILSDVDRYKRFGRDMIPLLCEIESILGRITIWRRFWKIHRRRQVPKTLFVKYWGAYGASRIESLLRSTEGAARDIRDEFDRTYGDIEFNLNDLSSEAPDYSKTPSFSSESDAAERLKARIEAYKRQFGVVGRTTSVLFRGPLFRKHLDSLKSATAELHESALVEYIQKWRCDANEVHAHASEVGTQHLYISMAETSATVSEAILEVLQPSRELIIDYQVNQASGIRAIDRSDRLEARIARQFMPYNFSLFSLDLRSILSATIRPSKSTKQPQVIENIDRTLRKWNHASQKPLLFMVGTSAKANMNIRTVIAEKLEVISLRKLLSTVQSYSLLQALHSEFSWRERIKLAYELAETAMLLLRTRWLTSVCSCRIHRTCIDDEDEEYEYYLRLNHIEHLEPGSGESQDVRQWCEEELTNMHFRRLGIVLIEVALGQPVVDAGYDHIKNQVNIDHEVEDFTTSSRSRACLPRETARRVEQAAGEDFSIAVEYCLRQGISPDAVGKRDLERFYNRVVAP